MTKQDIAKKSFAPGTSRGTRSRATLLANMARDLERQVAMGARLKELRESRPDLTQAKIADAIGITVRGYQFYEAGDSGIDHDRVVALAKLFEVTTKYLYDGEVEEPPVVDAEQIDRLERKVDELLEMVKPLFADRYAEAVSGPQAPGRAPGSPGEPEAPAASAK